MPRPRLADELVVLLLLDRDRALERQRADIEALHRDEAISIPPDFDYGAVGGLSTEARNVMMRLRPQTIGQANRLPGLTPAAVVAVLRHLKRYEADSMTVEGQA